MRGIGDRYLLLFLIPFLFQNVGRAQSSPAANIDFDRVPWRLLSFKANSSFGNLETDVQLTVVQAGEIAELLIASPQYRAAQASGSGTVSIRVRSNADPLLGSREELKTQSWFNPENIAALQRVRVRRGKQSWQKSYRFTQGGVYRVRKKPADEHEQGMTPDQWTSVQKAFYEYNGKDSECPVIMEPNGLLYLASAIDVERQQFPLSICVFNKKQLHRLKISGGPDQALEVDYLEKAQGTDTRIRKRIDAVKLSFEPSPLIPPDIEPETFSFLGLKGNFDIFLDKASGIPIQISGGSSSFGDVDILLHSAKINARRTPASLSQP